MKLTEDNRALTKRDLLNKLHKVEKALGTAAQRADAVERQNSALLAEVVRLKAKVPLALQTA
jgi:alkylated DNA nucleotide flippase Atl1